MTLIKSEENFKEEFERKSFLLSFFKENEENYSKTNTTKKITEENYRILEMLENRSFKLLPTVFRNCLCNFIKY